MAIEKFVFCVILPPVASTISGKSRNRKPPSHFTRLQLQPGASCVFRRTAQPSAMCGALYARANEMENAGVGEKHWRTPSSAARMVKFHAVPSDAQENILRSVRHRHSHLTTPVFVYATASALLTKCKSFTTPRFRQTCGRKYRTPCGGRSAKRGLLNNSQ